jgi:hypothetical protein
VQVGDVFEELATSFFQFEVSSMKMFSGYTGMQSLTSTGKKWTWWSDWDNSNGAQ